MRCRFRRRKLALPRRERWQHEWLDRWRCVRRRRRAAWYIAQVMALRAPGRSKTTDATPSVSLKRTRPSLMPRTRLRRAVSRALPRRVQARQDRFGVLTEKRRGQPDLLLGLAELHREADGPDHAFDRVLDLHHDAALAGMLAAKHLLVVQDRTCRDTDAQKQLDPLLGGLRRKGLFEIFNQRCAVGEAVGDGLVAEVGQEIALCR